MSKVEDLIISQMDSDQKQDARIQIMENTPGWSVNEDAKSTLRKLDWVEDKNIKSRDSAWTLLLYPFMFFVVPYIGYTINGFEGIFQAWGILIASLFVLWVIDILANI